MKYLMKKNNVPHATNTSKHLSSKKFDTAMSTSEVDLSKISNFMGILWENMTDSSQNNFHENLEK